MADKDLSSLVVIDVPRVAATQSVSEVLDELRARRFLNAAEIVVLDGEALRGVVSLETLLAGEPDARLGDLIRDAPVTVTQRADPELAATCAAQHGGRSVAVVDETR